MAKDLVLGVQTEKSGFQLWIRRKNGFEKGERWLTVMLAVPVSKWGVSLWTEV